MKLGVGDDRERVNLITGQTRIKEKKQYERVIEGSMSRIWQERDEGGLPPPNQLVFLLVWYHW